MRGLTQTFQRRSVGIHHRPARPTAWIQQLMPSRRGIILPASAAALNIPDVLSACTASPSARVAVRITGQRKYGCVYRRHPHGGSVREFCSATQIVSNKMRNLCISRSLHFRICLCRMCMHVTRKRKVLKLEGRRPFSVSEMTYIYFVGWGVKLYTHPVT